MYCGGGDDTRWPSEVLPASQFTVEHYNTLYPALFLTPSLSLLLSFSIEGGRNGLSIFRKGKDKGGGARGDVAAGKGGQFALGHPDRQ